MRFRRKPDIIRIRKSKQEGNVIAWTIDYKTFNRVFDDCHAFSEGGAVWAPLSLAGMEVVKVYRGDKHG